MKRYFLVFYKASFNNGCSSCEGYSELISQNFINRKNYIDNLKKYNPKFEEITLTNIIELTKEDYECFKKEEEPENKQQL